LQATRITAQEQGKNYCHSSLYERLQSCQQKTDYRIKEKALSTARMKAVKGLCNKIDDFYDSLSINLLLIYIGLEN